MQTISSRIIELREKYGLSGIDLAKRLGVNKSTITRYETGEIKPNVDMMISICQSFGISMDWLAGFDTGAKEAYEPVINECIKSSIPPERLLQAVQLLKG